MASFERAVAPPPKDHSPSMRDRVAHAHDSSQFEGTPFRALAALAVEIESVDRGGNGVPGSIVGTVVINETYEVRRAWVNLMFMEDGPDWQETEVITSTELPVGDGALSAGQRIRFSLEVPSGAAPQFSTEAGQRSWKVWAQADRRGIDLRAASDPIIPARARSFEVTGQAPVIPANAQKLMKGSSKFTQIRRRSLFLVLFLAAIGYSIVQSITSGVGISPITYLIYAGFLAVVGLPLVKIVTQKKRPASESVSPAMSEANAATIERSSVGGGDCRITVPDVGEWQASLVLFERSIKVVRRQNKTRKIPLLTTTLVQRADLKNGHNVFVVELAESTPPTHEGKGFATWYELRVHDVAETEIIARTEVAVSA